LPIPGVAIADVDGVLAKAGFDPVEPRDARGRWTAGGDSAADDANDRHRSARIQLADAGISDASNDPTAQAAARAAAVTARNNHTSGASPTSSWFTAYRNLWAAIVAFFGNPQNTTHAAEDAHELASKVLGRHLSQMPGVRNIYYNQSLNTITGGQIRSGVRPDVTVVMENDTVQPYEILSPGQKPIDMKNKYGNIQQNAGSKFRLAQPESKSIEQIKALPETAPVEAEELEEAEAQAALAALEEEEAFGTP
jgi:hypothetical protein